MSCAINWKLLEQQYFADSQYRKLKEYLKEMNFHFNEKLPVDERLLFADNSTKNFEQLTSFNKLASKDHVSMEIIEFMHLLMDECTHLVNFDVPHDTSLVKVLTAKDDAYVLRDGLADFRTIWPGKIFYFLLFFFVLFCIMSEFFCFFSSIEMKKKALKWSFSIKDTFQHFYSCSKSTEKQLGKRWKN